MHACIHVCRMNVCMLACMHSCARACKHACMHVCSGDRESYALLFVATTHFVYRPKKGRLTVTKVLLTGDSWEHQVTAPAQLSFNEGGIGTKYCRADQVSPSYQAELTSPKGWYSGSQLEHFHLEISTGNSMKLQALAHTHATMWIRWP